MAVSEMASGRATRRDRLIDSPPPMLERVAEESWSQAARILALNCFDVGGRSPAGSRDTDGRAGSGRFLRPAIVQIRERPPFGLRFQAVQVAAPGCPVGGTRPARIRRVRIGPPGISVPVLVDHLSSFATKIKGSVSVSFSSVNRLSACGNTATRTKRS